MPTDISTLNVLADCKFSYEIDTEKADKIMLHSLFYPENSAYSVNYVKALPLIDKIIFNNPATIVFWCDGTKTVVKCMEGQEFNSYYGVACAIMKKYFGNNSRAKAFIDKYKGEDGPNSLHDVIMHCIKLKNLNGDEITQLVDDLMS